MATLLVRHIGETSFTTVSLLQSPEHKRSLNLASQGKYRETLYFTCNIPLATVQCMSRETRASMAEYVQDCSQMIQSKYYTQSLTYLWSQSTKRQKRKVCISSNHSVFHASWRLHRFLKKGISRKTFRDCGSRRPCSPDFITKWNDATPWITSEIALHYFITKYESMSSLVWLKQTIWISFGDPS